MLALVILEAVVILLLAVLVAGLLRSHAEILRSLHALGIEDGTQRLAPPRTGHSGPGRPAELAPEAITGVSPHGQVVSASLRGSRGHTLLAFLSTGCTTCRPFWKAFAQDLELPFPDIRPVIVTAGPDRESPGELASMAPPNVLLIMSSEAWDAFRVPGTPYFQLVAPSGDVIGEGSAGTWPRLADLVRRAMGDKDHSDHLRRTTSERLADTDRELLAAGIEPGDSILYQKPQQP